MDGAGAQKSIERGAGSPGELVSGREGRTAEHGASRVAAAVTRRRFLAVAASAAGTAILAGRACPAAEAGAPAGEAGGPALVDANVSLGRWPLRRLPCDDTVSLVTKLRSRGIRQAWAGSLDGLLHRDLGAVNDRLAEECRARGGGILVPFGSIDPKAAGWEKDLRRAVEVHRFHGIRLHPGYHGYRLDDPAAARVLGAAAESGLVVQIALVMEDERMMHPLLRVEPTDPAPLVDLLPRTPGLRLVLLNALRTLRGELLRKLLSLGNVWVEISMLEGVGGLGGLLAEVPADRVLFGSHAPLFYLEAAELKLLESPLTPEQLLAVRWGNAGKILGRPGPPR